MKTIPLTQGQEAIVDDCDYEELVKVKWHARWNPKTKSYYAGRLSWIGKHRTESMHRRIMGLRYGDKKQVDHINRNTLDNRRLNLRIVDNRGNAGNRRDQSRYGVGIRCLPSCTRNPFIALSRVNGKYIHIGAFPTVEEARTARRQWLERNVYQMKLLDYTPEGDRCIYCNADAYTCEHYEEPRTFDGEDAEEWQRSS